MCNAADESSNGSLDVSSNSLINTFLNINPTTGAPNISVDWPTDQDRNPECPGDTTNSGNISAPDSATIRSPDDSTRDAINVGNNLPAISLVSSTSPAPSHHPAVDLFTPITLKENCIHVISRCSQVNRPPLQNLVSLCVDVMAWDPYTPYRCNMKLPCSMHTKMHEMCLDSLACKCLYMMM